MNRIRTILIFLVVSFEAFSQDNNIRNNISNILYMNYSKKADSLFLKKEYLRSIYFYNLAFKVWDNKGLPQHRYRAGVAYSALNKIDSGFYQLIRVAKKTEYLGCDSLERPEFQILKKDMRWNYLTDLLCTGSNSELGALLLKIRNNDQNCRKDIDSIGKKFGFVSPQMKSKWVLVKLQDSIDLLQVDSIYSIYGWPGPELVGKKANQAFWLVIQHSPLSVEKKYAPIMQQAVMDGKADPKNFAYLTDRILMYEDKPQKYGTQYKIKKDGIQRLYKLENEKEVNMIRDSVGLSPLTNSQILSTHDDSVSH